MALLALEDLHLSFGGVAALAGREPRGRAPATSSPSSAPTARARPASSTASAASTRPPAGASASTGATSPRSSPHQRAKLGIARTFQNIALFKGMTVLDNVKIGRHIHLRSGVLACGLYYGRAAREELAASRDHRARDHRPPRASGHSPQDRRHPALRPAEARGAGPGPGPRSRPAPPRRADRGHERGRDRGHGALHPLRQAGEAPHRGDDRARHGRGDGHLRPRGRARLRQEDRRGHARRGPEATPW